VKAFNRDGFFGVLARGLGGASKSRAGREAAILKLSLRTVFASMVAGLVLALTIGTGFADPSPPTNGGNGAGQSGQCTGPQADRPASCQSQGGPGG
jgi:hypothetical protein